MEEEEQWQSSMAKRPSFKTLSAPTPPVVSSCLSAPVIHGTVHTAQEQQIEDMKVRLENEEREAIERAQQLQERATILERQEADCLQRQNELERYAASLSEQENCITLEQLELQNQKKALQQREFELAAQHKDALERLNLLKSEQAANVEAKEKQHSSLMQNIQALKAEKDRTALELQSLEHKVNEHNQRIEQQQNQAADLVQRQLQLDDDERRLADHQERVSKQIKEVFKTDNDGADNQKKRKLLLNVADTDANMAITNQYAALPANNPNVAATSLDPQSANFQLSNATTFDEQDKTELSQLKVEQEDEVLMHGCSEVWENTQGNELDDDISELEVILSDAKDGSESEIVSVNVQELNSAETH